MSFYQSEKMMLMHPGTDDVVKHRMLQAKMLSREARGERLNLGKKMSVPRDVMMEELNLPSNRGSRMFQERQKRLERFTLENTPDTAHFNTSAHLVSVPPPQITQQPRGGKENQAFSTPGYSGPLKEIPREKFNTTVIPRLYCSPWREALGRNEDLLEALNAQLAPLPQRYQPANYRCFNRSARPFGGGVASKRVIPVVGFEAVETQNLPGAAIDRMCQRPNFNRAPAGWGGHPCPESNDL
ncbi:myozenin-2-like isoform X5 [Nerophis ophidion]|uniref:myozenin-2-like isoform X5 n=1 Tax=Nerophis ophidion TaxID=159077 RepID=UPI002ADFFF51|nr:myozenin-2-like isoform X5 [Nerophis ophidion]